jgi:hypothetical protein
MSADAHAVVEVPALCSQIREPFTIRLTPSLEGGWNVVLYVSAAGGPSPTGALDSVEGPFRMTDDFRGCPVCGETRDPVLLMCECGQVFCSHAADRGWLGGLTATCPACGATTELTGTAAALRGFGTQ